MILITRNGGWNTWYDVDTITGYIELLEGQGGTLVTQQGNLYHWYDRENDRRWVDEVILEIPLRGV